MKKKFDFDNKTVHTAIIDCLDCENYYTGACDGNAGGCNAYTPTRNITLSEDIREIKRSCDAILLCIAVGAICVILTSIIQVVCSILF